MDNVDSVYSINFKPILNDIQHEQSFISSDEYSSDTMPIIAGATSIDSSKSERRSKSIRTSTVVYGPILIKKRQSATPTIATGRRSKDVVCEGEDAVKRETRRRKNRESARNLKKLRDNIEHELEAKVNVLQSEEQDLLTQIDNFQIYKQYLEEQCQQSSSICKLIPRTASLEVDRNRQNISQTVPIRHDHIEIKEEPPSPSSQWQLSFSI
jgi:hypothetical protein